MKKQLFINFDLRFNLRRKCNNKPCIIYAVFTYKGKQIRINTQVKIYPHQWDPNRQYAIVGYGQTALDNANNMIVNERLKQIVIAFELEKYYICNNISDEPSLIDRIKFAINPQIKMKKKGLAATIILKQFADKKKDSTANQYKAVISIFATFLKENNIEDSLSNMNNKTLNQFRDFQCSSKKNVTTINDRISVLKRLLTSVSKSGEYDYDHRASGIDLVDKIKDNRPKSERRSKQVALSEVDILQLYNLSNLKDEYIEYRDLFVLQCWTGQRVSDILKLFNHKYRIDEDTISFINQKTKTTINISLNTQGYHIKEIINKYKNGFEYIDANTLGKAIDDSKDNDTTSSKYKDLVRKYNSAIKQLCEKADLNRNITYVLQLGEKSSEKTEPLYKLVHTHTSRHSYITNMLRRGIDKDIIKLTTGHTDDAMIDDIYQHLSTEDKIRQLHQGMAVSPQKTLELETTESNRNNEYIRNINEAKEVLLYLGVNPYDFMDVYDFSALVAMIGRREAAILSLIGAENTIPIKEIFNINESLKERSCKLHQLVEIMRSKRRQP